MSRVFCTISMLRLPLETLQAVLALVMAPRVSLHWGEQRKMHLDTCTTYAGPCPRCAWISGLWAAAEVCSLWQKAPQAQGLLCLRFNSALCHTTLGFFG